MISILFLLVPLLIKGYVAISVTISIPAITTVISLILLSGWKKNAIAIIGCMHGVIFAALLAFVGTGLNMMIVISSFGISFQQLINIDFIAIGIIRSLARSLGLVITVPIVAYLASK